MIRVETKSQNHGILVRDEYEELLFLFVPYSLIS